MGLDELAAAIQDRIDVYGRTGDVRALFADAVESEVDALLDAVEPEDPAALSPADWQRVSEVRQLVGTLFFLRFERTPEPSGDLSDLARTLLFHWPGLPGAAGDPPQPLRVLLPGPDSDARVQVDAALALLRHAVAANDGVCLQVPTMLLDDVVAAMPLGHHALPALVSRLLDAYLLWFRLTGDMAAAAMATDLSRQWLTALPADHPDRWAFVAALALVEAGKVQHGSQRAVRDAIDLGEQALAAHAGTSRRSPDHFPYEAGDGMVSFPTLLRMTLGNTYEFRYRLSLVPSDLDRCIELREAAAADQAWRDPGAVAAVSEGYLARFDRTGELPDLRKAVDVARRFLAIDDFADSDAPAHELATALVAIEHLVPAGRRFQPATPPPEDTRGGFFKRLWLARLFPSEEKPDGTDGDSVIVLGERALTVAGFSIALDETRMVPRPEDPATDCTLVRLSALYTHRFTQLGDKADIDRAVALVDLTRSLDQADDLASAARAHHVRFAVSQSVRDLEVAITLFERALEKTADDDQLWVAYNLADAYRTATSVSGNEEYLRRGADLCEQTLTRHPVADPARSALLIVLADIHRQRFRRSGDPTALDHAMDLYGQALSLERDASTLGSLGDAHLDRFAASDDPADLLLALGSFREALAMTSENTMLWVLGVARYCRTYRRLFDASPGAVGIRDLKPLADLCDRADAGVPIHRAVAYHAVGSLALALGQPRLAVDLLDRAVGLLRAAAWRDNDFSAQETYLRETRDLASDCVAAHLAVDQPADAVAAAERGRALTLGFELDIRADVADLAMVYPALAQRLDEVRDRLNTGFVYDLVGAMRDTVGRNNRTALWAEHDQLVEEIRRLPRFAGFLRSPDLAELRRGIETGGAVVLVNAAHTRADAVIVTSDADPVPVPLPDLTTADLATQASALLRAVTATPLTRSLRTRRVLTDILGWLWETTVEPILTALTEMRAEPRIWWLPTGTLGLFPLHAAGVDGRPGALDLAVSSYIPTLRALHHARQRTRPAARRQLTVALPHTPGFPPLPSTTAEATTLRARYPDHPFLTGTEATPGNVMATLTRCTWAHFACHASADPATSARAALHLHGGELPVDAISRLRLNAAELAYLSACSTATRGLTADEPTNLASAFHLAGFRHVVASLWPLTDTAAALAAKAFYDTLGDTGTADAAARGVRDVARELRAQNPHRPDLWAAVIHSGP
jgi:CHAT domain-containing protein/tetratricopeptide (TPR) repeat protein